MLHGAYMHQTEYTGENAMDSENGISRPTESPLYLLLSQCLCLSFYVWRGGRGGKNKQIISAQRSPKKNLPYSFHFTW